MLRRRAALAALLGISLAAGAEPRIPELEAGLAERIARSDFVFVWDLDSDTVGRGDAYRAYRTIHDGLMFAALTLFVGHLYLAVIHPATRHSLRGMTRGDVREDWARVHYPKWVSDTKHGV